MSPIKGIRGIGNNLGLVWWAKVETSEPESVYWFGPFLTRRSLKTNLPKFLDELSSEGAKSVKHVFMRCSRGEPLTI